MRMTPKVHGELMAARRAKRAARASRPDNNERALDQFMATMNEIRTALEALQAAADDHFELTPEEIHWGHVGDAQRILSGLKEVLAVARRETK